MPTDLERELSKLATYIAHSPALAPKAASGKDGEGLSKAHRLVEMCKYCFRALH